MTDEKFTIYTSINVPNCPFCIKAKEFLSLKNIPYSEIVIGKDISKEDFLAKYGPDIKTVPQIFIDGRRIGGYEALVEYFEKPRGHW